LLLVLEARCLVRAVAKWLALGMAATAERKRLASGESVGFALHVDKFDWPLDAQGSIIANRDLRHVRSSCSARRLAGTGCVCAHARA
jgi:hypothetical protein